MKKPISKPTSKTKPRTEYNSKQMGYFSISELTKKLSVMLSPFVCDSHYPTSKSHSKSTIIVSSKNNPKNTTSITPKKKTSDDRKIKKGYKTHKPKSSVLKINLEKIDKKISPDLNNNEINELKKILEKIGLGNEGEVRSEKGKDISTRIKGGKRNCSNISRTSSETLDDIFKISGKHSFKSCQIGRSSQNESHSSTAGKFDEYHTHYSTRNGSGVGCDSSGTRTILRAKPDSNIGNIRIKCVRPICVAQSSVHSVNDFSRCALKAHLGKGQTLLVSDPHLEESETRRGTVMHYDDEKEDKGYVIAKGTLMELIESSKTLREVRNTIFPESSSSLSISLEDKNLSEWSKVKKTTADASRISRKRSRWHTERHENDGECARESNPKSLHLPEVDEDHGSRRHWDAESFGTTLRDLERNAPQPDEPSGNPRRQPYIRKSSLDRLKEYIMSFCFCLRFGSHRNTRKKNCNSIQQNKKTLDENKIPYRPCRVVNAKITRITKHDFHCNQSKNLI